MSDSWQSDARKRLLRHVLRSGRDYAPDTRYDADARKLVQGPKAIHIAACLDRWAQMWAQDMRELAESGMTVTPADQDAQWAANMREANAEIDRYLTSQVRAA